MVQVEHHDQFAHLMADIRKYAGDPTLAERDILLGRSVRDVSRFSEELMNDASKTTLLLETLRVVRESTGPGKCRAEEEILTVLRHIAWECVGCLQEAGMTREACRTAGIQSSDHRLQPMCAVLTLLLAFARECFAFSRPRENFAGQRRSLAFEILGVIGGLLDLPDAVELARQAVKKGRADASGAMAFLETYLAARNEMPDEDLTAALLRFAKRAKRRGWAVGALNVLVETGTIGDLEACDRIDEWKAEHWREG